MIYSEKREEQEAIEPEIVSGGARCEDIPPCRDARETFSPPKADIWLKLKFFAAAALAFAGLCLAGLGLLLTWTVIGALIGLPLLAGGLLLLWLAFQVLAGGGVKTVRFVRRR